MKSISHFALRISHYLNAEQSLILVCVAKPTRHSSLLILHSINFPFFSKIHKDFLIHFRIIKHEQMFVNNELKKYDKE